MPVEPSMKPQSLAEIWLGSKNKSKFFRVRDVETLEDYLTVGILAWVGVVPCHMNAIKCDEWTFGKYMLNCNERKYALLSPPEELIWLATMSESYLITKIKSIYRKL